MSIGGPVPSEGSFKKISQTLQGIKNNLGPEKYQLFKYRTVNSKLREIGNTLQKAQLNETQAKNILDIVTDIQKQVTTKKNTSSRGIQQKISGFVRRIFGSPKNQTRKMLETIQGKLNKTATLPQNRTGTEISAEREIQDTIKTIFGPDIQLEIPRELADILKNTSLSKEVLREVLSGLKEGLYQLRSAISSQSNNGQQESIKYFLEAVQKSEKFQENGKFSPEKIGPKAMKSWTVRYLAHTGFFNTFAKKLNQDHFIRKLHPNNAETFNSCQAIQDYFVDEKVAKEDKKLLSDTFIRFNTAGQYDEAKMLGIMNTIIATGNKDPEKIIQNLMTEKLLEQLNPNSSGHKKNSERIQQLFKDKTLNEKINLFESLMKLETNEGREAVFESVGKNLSDSIASSDTADRNAPTGAVRDTRGYDETSLFYLISNGNNKKYYNIFKYFSDEKIKYNEKYKLYKELKETNQTVLQQVLQQVEGFLSQHPKIDVPKLIRYIQGLKNIPGDFDTSRLNREDLLPPPSVKESDQASASEQKTGNSETIPETKQPEMGKLTPQTKNTNTSPVPGQSTPELNTEKTKNNFMQNFNFFNRKPPNG